MSKVKTNDFVIHIGTVNGSGSQSANTLLVKSLFRMGLPVGAKNLFPSNIAGLPTWFTIRVQPKGFTARSSENDIVVAMNPASLAEDLKSVKPDGLMLVNDEIKMDLSSLRPDVKILKIPFKKLVEPTSDSVKLKKLLTNVVYVGLLAELMGIDQDVLESVVHDQFQGKEHVIENNLKAIAVGREYAKELATQMEFPIRVQKIPGANNRKILIDGNSAAALGLTFGGCSFAAWYPITPSSSLIEGFMQYADQFRRDENGNPSYAVVQAEDELASICMVIGAAWAGCRAVTATSGPGLSLMGEAAGLAYYAEVPAVIWDVQRVGPSTGLPTRTMQGDLRSAAHLSHGDVEHIVLLPGDPKECFEFGQTAFDLAERFNTLVIVLSDLDLGMNFHICDEFETPTKPFDRGKVLNREQLDQVERFGRYLDVDKDGITYRTLPGTEHPKAAYFTRGTGHDEMAGYSENNEVYKKNLNRLKKKFETARTFVPKPSVDLGEDAQIGIIAFGSSHAAMDEARDQLAKEGLKTSYLRLRALPFSAEVEDFLKAHKRVYVVEQNRDAQLLGLIRNDSPRLSDKLNSVLQYDGLPLEAKVVSSQILSMEKAL